MISLSTLCLNFFNEYIASVSGLFIMVLLPTSFTVTGPPAIQYLWLSYLRLVG